MIDKSLLLHAYNRLVYGTKKSNYSGSDFRKHPEDLEPTVFLSTGRCGTRWITDRLERSSSFVPIHHPHPVMRVQAKLMYNYDFNSIDQHTFLLLKEIFLAGREEIFVAAKRAGKDLAITDSRGTFFAYIIASIFPKAKFVFMHRNPIEVIRSGLKRGWYVMDNESELNRIMPKSDDRAHLNWKNYSTTQKIAWLWTETNQWIMQFLNTVPESQKRTIGFNNWNVEELSEVFQFMNAGVPTRDIEKNLDVRANVQRGIVNPQHSSWTEKDKLDSIQICGVLAKQLGYDIEDQ